MSNSIGKAMTVTLFGESHGPAVGAVLDGIAPGIKIDTDYIDECLMLRRPYGKISTGRCEKDKYSIVSGVFNGYTTGTPLTLLIPNADTSSKDYAALADLPRPSHADYCADCKYHGYQDYRGGGHFSGRITAALVAVGAIVRSALMDKGIKIATHISRLNGICDAPITEADIDNLNSSLFPVILGDAAEKMEKRILEAKEDGDSVGGVLESIVSGIPAGVGEPFFDSMESVLAHALFSVPGIKGVEFGAGFALADMKGSEANDDFTVECGKVMTKTNNSGGICGGITNGMPLVYRCAVKPTPSIFKEQDTVSLEKMENTTLKLSGRHDPAIIHRVRAVADAACAIVLCDMISRVG